MSLHTSYLSPPLRYPPHPPADTWSQGSEPVQAVSAGDGEWWHGEGDAGPEVALPVPSAWHAPHVQRLLHHQTSLQEVSPEVSISVVEKKFWLLENNQQGLIPKKCLTKRCMTLADGANFSLSLSSSPSCWRRPPALTC